MLTLAVLFSLILIPTAAVVDGWVLTKLWAWFMVPIFGLPQLALVPAIGLSLTVGYLVHNVKSDSQQKEDRDKWEAFFVALGKLFLVPLVYLLFGWVVSAFMQ